MTLSTGAPCDATINLPDGRRLSYAEWGDPGGIPVLHCHGMPGSRLEHEADRTVYAGLGVRVITPDRPGYGLSDPLSGRRLTDWAADVAELADELAISRFAVTALSGGGPFALACAAAMPERITRVVMAGCPAPSGARIPGPGLPTRLRLGLRLAAGAPLWLCRLAAGPVAAAVRSNPGFFVEHANHDNPADRRWIAIPWVRADATAMIQEAFRSGGRGYIDDVRALALGWDFDVCQIRVPVHLWHGDLDTVIPLSHARYLAAVIPNATLTICPGEGHMLMWSWLPQILLAARGTQGPDRSDPRDMLKTTPGAPARSRVA